MAERGRAFPFALAAAMLLATSLALFWPGYALYDSVAQYRQVVSGAYDDWHPPAMARVWALLHGVASGAGPMLAVQMGLYWLGLGLIAGSLARIGRRRAAIVALAIGAWPPWLGWQAAVLKDAQMAGATLAAVGVVAWFRLAGRALPRPAWAAVAALLGYATLVRANGVFAIAPLAVMLVPRMATGARATLAVAGITAMLAVSGPLNHGVMHAARSGVERTEAIYDLAGIAVRAGDARGLPLRPGDRDALIARGCVHAYFWDALGDGGRCEGVVAPWRALSVGRLYAALATAAVRHPGAYGAHRAAHLDSTLRWIVPARWPGAAPPDVDEPNTFGLAAPGGAATAFQRVAGVLVETPLAWPIVWVIAAATALATAHRRPATPPRDLAVALLVSSLALEASFAFVSIASDLRYHLWPMLAAAVALALIGRPRRDERRIVAVGGAVAFVVIAVGVAARTSLPAPPATYAGMLRQGLVLPECHTTSCARQQQGYP